MQLGDTVAPRKLSDIEVGHFIDEEFPITLYFKGKEGVIGVSYYDDPFRIYRDEFDLDDNLLIREINPTEWRRIWAQVTKKSLVL